MAHYSVHVGGVKRSCGQNAIAAAAYNARTKLTLYVTDKSSGIVAPLSWDYRQKEGLSYSKIHAPTNLTKEIAEQLPAWLFERNSLWNECEQAEIRKDAISAGKLMLALPNELSREQNTALMEEFVSHLTSLGMVVDVNIHYDHQHNPHAHLLHTSRELVVNREGKVVFSPIKNRSWQGIKWVYEVRELAERIINKHYQLNGFAQRVSKESYQNLGIKLSPGVHEGAARNIKGAELVLVNQKIAAANIEKIRKEPSLILDVLAINHPVFTKDQIAKELEKRLYAGIDLAKLEGKDGKDGKDGEAGKEAALSKEQLQELKQELASLFSVLYERIMNSAELCLVTESDLRGRELYSSRKRLELEERFITQLAELKERKGHVIELKEQEVQEEQARGKGSMSEQLTLSAEQQKAVRAILSGGDISILEGLPGVGKTTIMRELSQHYQEHGYQVIGVAASSSASLELEKAIRVKCLNASLWRKAWLEERGESFELDLRADYHREEKYQRQDKEGAARDSSLLSEKHIVIIDEASMVDLASLDYFTNEVRRAGAKLLLVGDRNQLAAISYRGAFEQAVAKCGSNRLTEIRRQQQAEHREASLCLSQYRIREAIELYWQSGAIKLVAGEVEAKGLLVRKFTSAYLAAAEKAGRDDLVSNRQIAIGVHSNQARNYLNREVRRSLLAAGVLSGREERVLVGLEPEQGAGYRGKYLTMQQGEQLIFRHNLPQLGRDGVYNGELATILAIRNSRTSSQNNQANNQSDHRRLGDSAEVISKLEELSSVNIDLLIYKSNGSQEKVRVDLAELAKEQVAGEYVGSGQWFDYGYALTAHRLQGTTLDQLFILFERQMGYEVFNVLATRHRLALEVVVSEELLNNHQQVAIGAKEEELAKEELVRLVSRRSNNSLASSYKEMGASEEDQLIKAWLDQRREVMLAMLRLSNRQKGEEDASGVKPSLWAQPGEWQEFKALRSERDELASLITQADSEVYRERLVQLGINYTVLEQQAKQAGQQRVSKQRVNSNSYQPLLQEKANLLHREESLIELVAAIGGGHGRIIAKAYDRVHLEITKRYLEIEEKGAELSTIRATSEEYIEAIKSERYYRWELLPAYLGRIYKPSSKANNQGVSSEEQKKHIGERVLAAYELLVEEYGAEEVVRLVSKQPAILGELRGKNSFFGKYFSRDKGRQAILALCDSLGSKLLAYSRSEKMIKEYQQKLEAREQVVRLNILERELAELHSLLPTSSEAKLLKLVKAGIETERSYGWGNYDWRLVQKQGLYQQLVAAQQDHEREYSGKLALTSEVVMNIFTQYAKARNSSIRQGKENWQVGAVSMKVATADPEGKGLGIWQDFKSGEAGNICRFMEIKLGLEKNAALKLLQAGSGSKLEYPTHQEYGGGKREVWQPVKWVAGEDAEFSVVGKEDYFLNQQGKKVEAQYSYYNIEGELIGHTLRVVSGAVIEAEKGADAGAEVTKLKKVRKQILPVSYRRNVETGKQAWQVGGFSDAGYKPLYGLEQLRAKPELVILIVEGEKAALAAREKLPEYNVVSWLGGVKAVDQVNWGLLKGKLVTIWPDNDQVGREAADKIRKQLDQQNGYNGLCSVVNIDSLQLPEKWDLADELPKQVKIEEVRSLVTSSLMLESVKSTEAVNSLGNKSNNELTNELTKESTIEFTDNKLGSESEYSMIEKISAHALAKLDELELKNDKYVERLQAELKVIEKRCFAQDFILAQQVAHFARSHDIMLGAGRGSAVGSLTAYLLDIHAVDPVQYELSFERFLTMHSKGRPDFDLDVESNKKEVIEDYIFSKYPQAAKLEVVVKTGERRTHSAGIVFIDEQTRKAHDIELSHLYVQGNYFPRAALTKEQVQALNISKLDLLASKTLERIKLVEDELQRSGKEIDWQQINWEDQQIFTKLSAGDLKQVYQLGSVYAKEILTQVGVKSFSELVAMQALIRPGARQIIDQYQANQAKNDTLPELSETRGVILYQEQIMQLAENYLGVRVEHSNDFRKDLAKLASGRQEKQDWSNSSDLDKISNLDKMVERPNFIRAALANSKLSEVAASKLYEQLLAASSYCFNKSHATAYAMVSFKTAYISSYHGELSVKREISKVKETKLQQVERSKAKIAAKSPSEYLTLLSSGIEKVRHYGSDAGPEQHKEYEQLMKQIKQAGSFLQQQDKQSEEQLLKTYKLHTTPAAIYTSLLKACRQRSYTIIKQRLNSIEQGKLVIVGEKKFTCQKSYLEYLQEHSKHEFLPREQIKASLDRIRHQELEMHKQPQMTGPTL